MLKAQNCQSQIKKPKLQDQCQIESSSMISQFVKPIETNHQKKENFKKDQIVFKNQNLEHLSIEKSQKSVNEKGLGEISQKNNQKKQSSAKISQIQKNLYCIELSNKRIGKIKSAQSLNKVKDDSCQSESQSYSNSSICIKQDFYQQDLCSSDGSINHRKQKVLSTISFRDISILMKPLYSKLKTIFSDSQYYLVMLISNNSNSYIARLSIVRRNKDEIQVQIQKGQYAWQIDSTFREAAKTLWGLGLKDVLSWIRCIALGISELEQLGIYHPSLSLQGTIRVLRGGRSVFKIADFSDAFKVAKSLSTETGKDKAFELTRDIFDFWLRFRYDLKRPRKPCYHFADDDSDSNLSASSTQTFYDESDILKQILRIDEQYFIQSFLSIKHQGFFLVQKRIDSCIVELQKYAKRRHLRQFRCLAKDLLQPPGVELIPQLQNIKDNIQASLGELSSNQISYQQFAEAIQNTLEAEIKKRKISEVLTSTVAEDKNNYEEDI